MIEPATFAHVDKALLTNYFKHVCFAFRKFEDREFAITKLRDQLTKLKKISKTKTSPKDIADELADLEDKIAIALEKERSIIKHVFDQEGYSGRLHNRIAELDSKLGSYLNSHKINEKRVKALEKKISGSTPTPSEDPIQKRLEELEDKLKRLSRHKRANKVKIKMLQGKIDMIRSKID
ncbi:MAG: hypothetical protein QF632_04355 [Candidatus Woesearchaeota archaeon]|jgi:chromosome segregation ATPase|nr:hypothetical protein [Candidatus Woesearchaeota archaeon]